MLTAAKLLGAHAPLLLHQDMFEVISLSKFSFSVEIYMSSLLRSACIFLAILTFPLTAFAQSKSAEDELVKMHQELLQFHLNGDVEGWLATESEQYVVANRGEVTHPSKKDREARIKPYLKRTRFREYRDLIAPVVRVSSDGSLAWLIAQVKASGVQTSDDGKQAPIEFTSAWIELFEKKDGKWVRVGNVSNFKPPN